MRFNTLFAARCLAIAAVFYVIYPAAADEWRAYHNKRYDTTIEYPNYFRAGTPPINGDGLEFKSPDGAEFSIFASYNAMQFDLAGLKDFITKNLKPGEIVTYQAQGDNWFVISGMSGDRVIYERHLLSHGGQMTEGFVMSYPSPLKHKYDPVAARMSKSFRSSAGYQTPGKP